VRGGGEIEEDERMRGRLFFYHSFLLLYMMMVGYIICYCTHKEETSDAMVSDTKFLTTDSRLSLVRDD